MKQYSTRKRVGIVINLEFSLARIARPNQVLIARRDYYHYINMIVINKGARTTLRTRFYDDDTYTYGGIQKSMH